MKTIILTHSDLNQHRRKLPFISLAILSSLFLLLGSLESADAKAGKDKKKKAKSESVESLLRFKAGDEDGNEIKALKTEMLVLRSEKRALAQALKLLKKHKGKPLEPEILFRLAELYMRRARSHRFFEIHKDSNQVMSFVPTLVKTASEAGEIRKAIGIYEQMRKRFPDYRNTDVVIFNTAYAKQQLGDDKGAEALFNQITTQFGDSLLVPDAFLAMGEINYSRREFQKALKNFKSVRNYPNARVYPYALYKAAWCHYNMQDARAAMRHLEEVVKFGRMITEQKLDAKLDLRKEALSDLAMLFGEVYPASKAVSYFLEQSEGLDPVPVLMRLTSLYNRHSRYADIETVLREMLVRLPDAVGASQVHEELVWNHERMRQRPKAVAQLSEFASYCKRLKEKEHGQKEKTAETDKGQKPVSESVECLSKIATVSKQLAGKWHALWKAKQPTEELAASAEQAYKIYFDNGVAAEDADLAKMRFSYAEILFQRKKFRESSEQYALVQTAKPDAKLSHDAAYGAVVALEKANDNKWNDEDEKRFVGLSDVYLKLHPKGEYALELRFKRSFIAYDKGRYDEAATGFKEIGWNSAVTDKTKDRVLKAQDLYLDILNIKKDYTSLKTAAESLVKRGIRDDGRLTSIKKIYREAYFAEIQRIEEKGDFKGAIVAYKKFALENKTADLSNKAWWNASQLQFKSGDVRGGAESCHQMHKLFPKSTQAKDCLTQAAQTFETIGQLQPAADVLMNLAEADGPNAQKWQELAADFTALSGEQKRAIQMYTKLIDGKAKAKIQLGLYVKIREIQKMNKDMTGYKKTQAKIQALGIDPHASAVVLEHAEELLAKGDLSAAFNTAKKVVSRGSLPKDLLARARFVQAQVLEDEFRRQSVKARMERIAMVLAIKTEKLEKAQRAFQETIKYGDPKTSVAALRRLAGCYLHYSQAVRAMPLSSDLPEADLAAFKTELDGLVIPMEEKGIDSLSQALQAARKFALYDGSVAEIENEINKVNMKKTTSPVEIKTPAVVLPNVRSVASTEVGT